MSRAPAGFETFCPEVPVKTRASTFAVLAFVISEMGGILCTPILPPQEREKRRREVEQQLFDVFRKYAGQRG